LVQYVVARLLWLIPTILAMALVTFLVMHATPGSPLDPVSEGANPLSPEAQKVLAQHYGLDKPLWQQFAVFIANAVRGDFGFSFVYKTRTVAEILRETFPISLFLGSMALVLAVTGGLTLGVLAAVYQNRGWDYVSVSLATVGVAVPNFVLAVFLIILFSFVIPLFPTGGWDSPSNWVLPTITLAAAPMGIIARFTRASMLEVIRADYTLTARAKGLGEVPVILKHALKNAFIPVVTLLGPMAAAVGTGSFFVESIFRVPGMGRFFVESMTGRDYPMIMAVVLTYGGFLAVMNLVVDLLYGALDPRIRY
jgi:peptide/nickel transport system permease protein